MAWIIGDSFDFYSAVADAAGLWTTITAGTISSTTRFGAGRSYQFGNIAVGLEKSFGSNEATVFCATAFLCAAGSTGAVIVAAILLQDGATTQCSVCFERPGNIVLRSGGITGAVLATYANAFQPTVWDHFQIKVVIHNTTGAITVRKNGDAGDTWSATGLNTRGGTANNYANAVRLRSDNAVTSAWFDDFLCFSGSGAAPNDWVGDIRAVQLLPSADTAQRDFSRSAGATNSALVDEAVQNGDTDYVFSGTPNHQDLYDLSDLATTPASILAVQARMFAKKTDSGARSGQIRVKSGATEAGGADTVLSTSYTWLSRVGVTDPNTGAAWTAAAVNAAQLGPKVTA
jgi:hypothetical protein